MKKAENSEKRPEIWRQVFRRMKNQGGASLMAALLFFVFCGVGASIILGVRLLRRAGKDPPPAEGGPEAV